MALAASLGPSFYCKAYPDEKGIETGPVPVLVAAIMGIAKPIPMKRELKLDQIGSDSHSGLLLQSLSR